MSNLDVVENLHKLPQYDKDWIPNSRHMRSTFNPLLPSKFPGGATAVPLSPPPAYPGSPIMKKRKPGKKFVKVHPTDTKPIKQSPHRRSPGDGQSVDRRSESETSFVHPVPDMFATLPPGNKPLPPVLHPSGPLKPLKPRKKNKRPNALKRLSGTGRAPSPFLSDSHVNENVPVDIPFDEPWNNDFGGTGNQNQGFELDISQTPFPPRNTPTPDRPESEQSYSEYPNTNTSVL